MCGSDLKVGTLCAQLLSEDVLTCISDIILILFFSLCLNFERSHLLCSDTIKHTVFAAPPTVLG